MKPPHPHPTAAPTVLMVIHTCLLSAGLSFDKSFRQRNTPKLVSNLHSAAAIAADPWVLQLIGLYAQSRVNELHLCLHEAHAQQSSDNAAH